MKARTLRQKPRKLHRLGKRELQSFLGMQLWRAANAFPDRPLEPFLGAALVFDLGRECLGMPEPREYDLLDEPEIAAEVGFLIMYCANIDVWLKPAFAMLLGGDDIADSILRHVDNLTAKKDVLFDIAAAESGRHPLADELLATREAVNKAIAFRNALAHGNFGFNAKTGALDLVSGVLSQRRGKPKSHALTPAEIRAHVVAIKAMIAAIRRRVLGVYATHIPGPALSSRGKPPSRDPRRPRRVPKAPRA